MKKLVLVAGLAAVVFSASAKIELGAPFTDGAVLQRGVKCPIWGTATPGNRVVVEFAGQSVVATADAAGKWRVALAPLTASAESRELKATELEPGWLWDSPVAEATVGDVLVGEVWFASGQSNMSCPLWGESSRFRDANGALVAAMANQPLVRLCRTPQKWSLTPLKLKAKWFPMTAAGLKTSQISAVGYYFARELYLALGVPVGVINSAWGGTNIDAWTPRCGWEGKESLRIVAELPLFDAEHQAEFVKSMTDGAYAEYAKQYAPVHSRPQDPHPQQQPTVLWNGMVKDYAPFACKGFIWYQGCHNAWEHQLYCAKMHALYDGWRQEFENPNLKLYFVQLAPYTSNWNGLAAAQNQFAAEEPNAAISVISDWGNFRDIHPCWKEVVGKRLVVHALKRDYGFPIEDADSPVCTKVEYSGNQAILSFDHVQNWYVYNADRSKTVPFQLAGADGVWHEAKILNWFANKRGEVSDYIHESRIVLQSEAVAKPMHVRYMGEKGTAGTLFNQLSLPLGPFER